MSSRGFLRRFPPRTSRGRRITSPSGSPGLPVGGADCGRLEDLVIYGLPDDYFNHFTGKILAVTPADVERVARKYIKTENLAFVVVGDRKEWAEVSALRIAPEIPHRRRRSRSAPLSKEGNSCGRGRICRSPPRRDCLPHAPGLSAGGRRGRDRRCAGLPDTNTGESRSRGSGTRAPGFSSLVWPRRRTGGTGPAVCLRATRAATGSSALSTVPGLPFSRIG